MSAPTLLARFLAADGAPSQAELAAASGMSAPVLSRLASGAIEMTPARAMRLAPALERFGGPSAAALLLDQLARLGPPSLPPPAAVASAGAGDFPASGVACSASAGTGRAAADVSRAPRPGLSVAASETV